MKLHLDFETRSTVDIKTAGLDNYARNAEILMLAWAVDDGDVNLWVPAENQPRPTRLMGNLVRSDVVKVAWNSQFERAIFLHCLGLDIPPEQWLDPKILARYASIPASLQQVGEILGLSEDTAKIKDGKRLIQKFCKPHKGVFKQPSDHPEDWEKFKEYCRRDVVAERELLHKLRPFALPPMEERLRVLDAKINECGLPVDVKFVQENRQAVEREKAKLTEEMRQITQLENPNSVSQLLAWLKENGYPYGSLGAKKIDVALKEEMPEQVRRVLFLRQQVSKSSTAKLDALAEQVSPDGRLRYCYQFYGAARTGRWAGAGPQPHNFPRKPITIGNVEVDLRAAFRPPEGV